MAAQLVSDWYCATCGQWETVPQGERPSRACCAASAWKWRATRTFTPELVPNRFGRSAALDVHVSSERIAPIGGGIRVDSLRDIRRIERESEKMAADGVGEALRFRCYSQDGDKRSMTNSFGPPPAAMPDAEKLASGKLQIRSAPAGPEAIPLGPGVTEQTQTDVLGTGAPNG